MPSSTTSSNRWSRCLVMAGFLAAVTLALVSGSGLADDDDDVRFKGYRKGIDRARHDQHDHYQQWHDRQRNSYGKYRVPPGQLNAAGPKQVLKVPSDPLIGPGTYDLNLPLGNRFRIQVEGDYNPQGSGWRGQNYATAEDLTEDLAASLRNVHVALLRHGHPQANTVAEARVALHSMEELLHEQAPLSQVEEAFSQFDVRWHQIAHQLEQAGRQHPELAQWVRVTSERDESMHRLIDIGPGATYNRLQVLALTEQLRQRLAGLPERLDRNARRDYGDDYLSRLARRVARQADDLAEAAHKNAALTQLLNEHQEFDRQWRQLINLADQQGRGAFLRDLAQEVFVIDRALHQELAGNSPIFGPNERLAAATARVVQSSEQLVRELRHDLGNRPERILYLAETFAVEARQLHAVIEQNLPSTQYDQAVAENAEAYKQLYEQLPILQQQPRFQRSQQAANALHQDIANQTAAIHNW